MQLPEPAPPPLAPLWDRILRAQALPPDLDVQLLYVAIRDRLTHPEWEVRLHALRVLADLLPLSGNALSFPFDQVVDNLGHNSPNVRKAALDALKVFCSNCEEPECAARAILEKCYYQNIRPHSADLDYKANVITGLILSLPSAMAILKRRCTKLDVFPVFQVLGEKLFDLVHKDVALRSLIKLRRVCGPRDYMMHLSQLDAAVQNKFRTLCVMYDEDSDDVHYAPRKTDFKFIRDIKTQQLIKVGHSNNNNNSAFTPLNILSDSSSEELNHHKTLNRNNFGKVIIETEIKFDSDTAITMTVLEENETEQESDRNAASEEDEYDSSDRNMLEYNEVDSEDTDVIVKKVRFGGESIKIRTPDSENNGTSEDDNKRSEEEVQNKDNMDKANVPGTPLMLSKANELKSESNQNDNRITKKSAIPLPIIKTRARSKTSFPITKYNRKIKKKSRSLSELYDYFRTKNGNNTKDDPKLELKLIDVHTPNKLPSPVPREPHLEVEVLHNLQRSPLVSPRRQHRRVEIEHDGLILSMVAASSPDDFSILSPRPPSSLQAYYVWEDFGIVPQHVVVQLHNTENWISAVKAADQLHSVLLEEENVQKIEPAAASLVHHMWALSDTVAATKAPAEGAVCALLRGCSSGCARRLLPLLLPRLAREPPPAALPHALLQRLALHHIVELIFDRSMIGVSGDNREVESGQLRATLCLARAAGPAAVLSAVRGCLAGTARADSFCHKLREILSRPLVNTKGHVSRISQLPVPVRRRARSTPPPVISAKPRRLRPLPDSAPLPGIYQGRNWIQPLSPIQIDIRDSSAVTTSIENNNDNTHKSADVKSDNSIMEMTIVDITVDDEQASEPTPPQSPSLHVEDCVEKNDVPTPSVSPHADNVKEPDNVNSDEEQSIHSSHKSLNIEPNAIEIEPAQSRAATPRPQSRLSSSQPPSRKSSPSPMRSQRSATSSFQSRNPSPAAHSEDYEEQAPKCERDVRNALMECIVPAKHEDWEVIVNSLVEIERLAVDPTARAPATTWKAIARSTSGHVRSLRSRVARTACSTLGALFDNRGRSLDSEMEEAIGSLLERCADVNRFLRADAAAGLTRVACGGSNSRAVVALCKRGTSHRAGPVRAAATQALTKLVQQQGASRILDMSADPRTLLLRSAGELLCDASEETRLQGRQLCIALAEDLRFRQMLKESITPTRYRTVEKYVDRLRCR